MTTQNTTAPTSIADALDKGIALADANGAPPPPPADDDDTGTDGGTTDDTSTTDQDAGGAGTDAAPGGDAAGAGATDAGDGTGTDGDGTDPTVDQTAGDDPAGKDDAGTDAAGALDPAKAGTKDGKQVKPDPLTAPIPNALKPETKERIRTLVERTKTAESALSEATAARDELITAVKETGATPEQYAATLDYLSLVCSGDRNKQIQAANFMIRELSALSRIGGFRIPGITTYAGHKDLEDAVAAGTLKPELAEELAATRAAAAHQGKVGAAQAQMSEARRKYQEADTAARAEVNTIEAEFAKRDPLYAAKQPIILGILNETIRGDRERGIPPMHPSKWPATFRKIYENLPKTGVWGPKRSAVPGTTPGARAPVNTPIRGQQPAGAQKQEPKSVAEALDMGIEMARGG